MENYGMESLYFRYSRSDYRKIYSVCVNFTSEDDDSIIIGPSFIKELSNYMYISEDDKELFYVLAKAIQLSKENNNGSTKDNRVKKYKLSTSKESFAKRFVRKLMLVAQTVPMDLIVKYFNEDAKLEDLDIFLNQKSAYELTFLIGEDIDTIEELSMYSEEDC